MKNKAGNVVGSRGVILNGILRGDLKKMTFESRDEALRPMGVFWGKRIY